jgi:signal transduction histidine kinase
MRWLLYLRLITLTAGTLLPFFWMVVILGHRRQRNFERILFFLCLALTCFCGSTLLALNAQLYYDTPPRDLMAFAWTFLCLGLWAIPSLLVHLHVAYAAIRNLVVDSRSKGAWIALAYAPAVLLLPRLVKTLQVRDHFPFQTPSLPLGGFFQLWLLMAVAAAVYWQSQFRSVSPDPKQRALHFGLQWNFVFLDFALLFMFFIERGSDLPDKGGLESLILWGVIGPFIALIRDVQRYNFLQIGRQRNLIYAVFGVFVALLYLSFIRRASLWLEPHLPPEATSALLLFLPVVFFEPLQRAVRKHLRETAQSEIDRAQKLFGPISERARLGDLQGLGRFVENWVAEQLQLADVKLEIQPLGETAAAPKRSSEEIFQVARPGQVLGQLRVRAHGAMISGETYAALEFVAEQLPAAFDLCRLIGEKLQLERELAERERMALVGQMAASISHNLKNPLGSIKTILQVQMEGTDLPTSLRGETQMVLDEINRLSAKLNQLLQFSRPGARPSKKGDHCNIVAVAVSVAEVLCREAESSGVSLNLGQHSGTSEVAASAESANDILSNVILNAIEAASPCGRVCVGFQCEPSNATVVVEDDGPGIPPALREKILQPFFTTKPRGTGLGLAIVARRMEEIGGKLQMDSPIAAEHGSRFRLTFPLAPKENAP